MKYAVEQKYFDSGRLTVSLKSVPDHADPVFDKNCATHDLYVDIFDTKKEAVDFMNEARNA